MQLDLHYLTKPLPLIGVSALEGTPGSHHRPERLHADGLLRIRDAAPLHLDELAALLCGLLPFDIEPSDDKVVIRDWQRVFARLSEAARLGAISAMPTLREGVLWAIDVGCPVTHRAQLLRAAGISGETEGPGPQAVEEDSSKGQVNPTWQSQAREISDEEFEKTGRRPKRTWLAEEVKRRHALPQDWKTIERRIRTIR